MTLFWHQAGPLMRYQNGMLEVEDLNPEVKTKWTMSRMEMLKLGWRCIRSALS
jgi:hypothetical protein